MFFDIDRFEPVAEIRKHWQDVLREFQENRQAPYASWHEDHLFDNDWQTLVLFDGYKREHPTRVEPICALFPITTRLLQNVPELLTAGFSVLGPKTTIKVHRGFDPTVLRVHLGLETPEACGISVRGQHRTWRAGELLAFDDTQLHEAWNSSDYPRAILLLDLKYPRPVRLIFRSIIQRRTTLDIVRHVAQHIRFQYTRVDRRIRKWT